MASSPEPRRPADVPRRVAVLGSTGSIGRQAMDVLRGLKDLFQVVALAAGSDQKTLEAQAAEFRPRVVHLADTSGPRALDLPAGTSIVRGREGLLEIASREDVDLLVVATGGLVSLAPVLEALRAGKVVATANKETLVAAGHLVMPLCRDLAARWAAEDPASAWASPLAWLRPIDSEHSAIWQCLAGEQIADVRRLVLTASGGPFLDRTLEELQAVTSDQALAHPTWRMGSKISIDSATLMNKGLEVVEARWLYDVPYGRIAVVIHPQSIVHSLVEFIDGSFKAQLGLPDMRIPIQYALTYPSRAASPAPALELTDHDALSFRAPDDVRFPAVELARRAGGMGPWATAALISADEVAVERFLGGSLDFPGITRLVSDAVDRFGGGEPVAGGAHGTTIEGPSLEELLALDAEVRAWTRSATPGAA